MFGCSRYGCSCVKFAKANFNPLVTKAQSVEDLVRYSVDLWVIEDFVTEQTIVGHRFPNLRENRPIGRGHPAKGIQI